jgi:hypothetical protein
MVTPTTAAARATVTGTSRSVGLALVVLAATVAGCGGARRPENRPAPQASGAGWLRPAAAPATWPTATISTGAVLAYPAGWRPVAGDRGTATAVLRNASGAFLGYLNITPRQGNETQAGWARFRVAHNANEGDLQVRTLARYADLRFRTGSGTCVRDEYVTKTGARYVELACLVAGRHATTVIVGAAPPTTWPRTGPQIERAISAFTT